MAQNTSPLIHNMHQSSRDTTFDIMKGIGIILVLLGHVWSAYIPITNHVIISFHMPLFFIVAGYFSKPYTDWNTAKKTIVRYIRRLVIPMALTEIAITLWSTLMAITKGTGWNTVITNALSIFWADVYGPKTPFGQLSLGVIWFLMALLTAKTILLFLSRLNGWAIPLSLIASFITIELHKLFPYSICCITLGISALPFVTIGWWVKSHRIPLAIKLICIVCWGLALYFSRLEMYAFSWKCFPLDVLGACGATYCMFLLCRWVGQHLKLTSKVLAYLGVTSLAIMCMHGFEIETHLGNHLRALIGLQFSIGWLYVWRYAITIALAFLLLHIPKVNKIFV